MEPRERSLHEGRLWPGLPSGPSTSGLHMCFAVGWGVEGWGAALLSPTPALAQLPRLFSGDSRLPASFPLRRQVWDSLGGVSPHFKS